MQHDMQVCVLTLTCAVLEQVAVPKLQSTDVNTMEETVQSGAA